MTENNEMVLHTPEDLPDWFKDYIHKFCRFTALGFMSSAIMHEIGNALTVISGNAQIIQYKKENQTVEQILKRIDGVMDQINRVQTAIDRVGSFGARAVGRRKEINPYQSLSNAVYALRRRCNLSGIELELAENNGGGNLYYDPSLLEFIILELLAFFLQDSVEKANLFIRPQETENQWILTARLIMDESSGILTKIWDDPYNNRAVLGALIALESLGGEVVLTREEDCIGWKLTITRDPEAEISVHD